LTKTSISDKLKVNLGSSRGTQIINLGVKTMWV